MKSNNKRPIIPTAPEDLARIIRAGRFKCALKKQVLRKAFPDEARKSLSFVPPKELLEE